jgi:FkbM family methyltransferase
LNFIKRLIPNNIKQEGKYFLLDLLKISYSRSCVPLEILKWLPKNKPITFFDIGASVGHFAVSICGEYQIEKGILIEPVSKLTPILEEKFPDRDIFKILNIAVSDSNSVADFYVDEAFDSVSSLLKIYNKSDELISLNINESIATKIQTLTLDDITKRQNLSAIDLIKIDVQGAEHLVLRSGIETLKKTKMVYTEFSFKPLYEASSVFVDLYKIFYENNFVLVDINRGYTSSNGELLQGDALFINKGFMDEKH